MEFTELIVWFEQAPADPERLRALASSLGLELTRREFALLEYLVLRRGQVVRREEIKQSLYETCVGPTSNVVDACVLRLRRKLDAAQSTAQVQTLRGIGYRFDAAAR